MDIEQHNFRASKQGAVPIPLSIVAMGDKEARNEGSGVAIPCSDQFEIQRTKYFDSSDIKFSHTPLPTKETSQSISLLITALQQTTFITCVTS